MGSPSAPKTPNPSKTYEQGIQIYLQYLPQLLAAEQNARTQYDPQRIAEQQGLQAQYGPTQYQQQLDALNQLDPSYVADRQQLSDVLSNDLAAGSGLTPDMEQQVEGYVRAAQAARGNVLGNAPATAEAYAKGDLGRQLLQQRVSNMQGFLAQPTIPQQLTAIAPVSADRSFSFVNPSAGYAGQNFALQNYQNVLGAQAIGNSGNPWGSALGGAASGAAAGSAFGPYGALIGGVAGGLGGYFSSDRRLKRDIVKVCEVDGLGLYEYKYVGQDGEHLGFMADEVLRVLPEAVAQGPGGFLMVDYGAVLDHLERVV
jgi:hypothetical protein